MEQECLCPTYGHLRQRFCQAHLGIHVIPLKASLQWPLREPGWPRNRLQQLPMVEMFFDIVFLAIDKEHNVAHG